MNIYEFAMKMEKDGEELYLNLASQTKQPGLKKIFELLAHEEVKHYDTLKEMSEGSDSVKAVESKLFDNVKDIFEEIKEHETNFEFHETAAGVYKDALDLEIQTRTFYEEKAAEMDNPDKKVIMERLIREEQTHEQLMHWLIDFVSRPETWLENAEWNHFDEY